MKRRELPTPSQRLCVFCKHLSFWGAIGIGQEGTGGGDASIECNKGHWSVGCSSFGESEFRQCILKADKCPDYDESEK